MKNEADSILCGRCHQPVSGFAEINGVRYCHPDFSLDGPTCYELATWEGGSGKWK